ncbi:MAG TPA: farnesyl diphosphate synthase [Spongiibacteraceae bacterium]|nr:farnesyl diphosphate synthase [Spongiibacteraceae bacterium]
MSIETIDPAMNGDTTITGSIAIENYIELCRARINAQLAPQLGTFDSEYSDASTPQQLARLFEAMRYSLLNGGKRVRPLLVYAAAAAVTDQCDAAALDGAACAVEYLHTYSLVHDDLPAMDDDDLRRGNPTCHRAFDEATAILAGDALQSRAFELLSQLPSTSADIKLSLINTLAAAAGPRGMVGGQAIDLAAVQQQIDLAHLETMHRLKTGALIRAAVRIGALLAGANVRQLAALDSYAAAIGLSFQVQDDILDITSDTATLGKQQGADIARDKPTYPALLGLMEARAKAQALHRQAVAALSGFDTRADRLRQLSAYIVERRN